MIDQSTFFKKFRFYISYFDALSITNDMSEIKSIGMLLFDEVELLDFAGPLEVFGAANYIKENSLYTIKTIAPTKNIKVSKSVLNVIADEVIDQQQFDLLFIPGGFGTRPLVKNESFLASLDQLVKQTKITASICTGALLLAKLGYLQNKTACSHHLSFEILESIEPTVQILKDKRYVDHGRIVTSAGVSAGIDMSFHLLKRLYSAEFSNTVRKYIEYFPEA